MPALSLIDFAAQTDDPMRTGLVQKITNESIFLRRLRFVKVDGFTYTYGEQTTLGGVAFRSIGGDYTADVGVVNPKIETMGIFGGKIQTDHQMVVKSGDAARANQIAARVRKAGLFYDLKVIKGDSAIDPKNFSGLNARLVNKQLISAGVNGGALTLDLVNRLLDAVVGLNSQKVLVMSKAIRRSLKNLILNKATGTAVADISGSLDSYDGCPIEVIDEDGDESPILDFNETWGTSTVAQSLYCIRPGSDIEGEFMQGLVGGPLIEHYVSGMQGTQHVDIVDAHMGIALFHGRSAARVAGVLS